jgi:hypothetical protein
MKRCFKVSRGHANFFCVRLKKQFVGIRLSDVLSRRMALRTHNQPSGSLENDFGEVDEAMFQSAERSFLHRGLLKQRIGRNFLSGFK